MPRNDPVQDPSPWTFKYRDRTAEAGWKQCIKQQPTKTLEAYNAIRTDPRRTSDDQYRLRKRDLATAKQDGKWLERWQYKLAGGARVWYLVDVDEHVVWLDVATLHHPKETQ